jgi:hypothetical protein
MKRLLALLPVLLIAGFALKSEKKTLAARWDVSVRSTSGSPIPDAQVSRNWQDYDFDEHGGEDVLTDMNGTVHFPEVIKERTKAAWFCRKWWHKVNLGVHSSSGKDAHVVVTDIRVRAEPQSGNCSGSKCETALRTDFVAVPAKD